MLTIEQVLVSIEASADILRREFDRADSTVAGFERTVKQSMDRIDRELARTGIAFSGLRENIDRAMRIGDQYAANTQRQAQNIAAYGVEMDRLRAKYNPLFAAQQQYRTQLEELNRALNVGAINQSEFGAALGRTKAQFADQVRMLNAVRVAGGHTSSTLAAGSKNYQQFGAVAQQAGYQIGDFAVQVASGQNAVVAFTQQSSQLLGFFGPVGAVAGAAAAIFGGLYLALDKTSDSAGKASKSVKELTEQLEKYRSEVARINKLGTDFDSALGSVPERLQSQYEKTLTGALEIESKNIRDYNDQVDALQKKIREFEATRRGERGPSSTVDQSELDKTKSNLTDVTALLDEAIERSESMQAQLNDLQRFRFDPGGYEEIVDASTELNSRLTETYDRLEALQTGGLQGAAAFDRLAKAESIAEKQAESYNDANERAIKSGQLRKKTAEDFLPTAMSIVDAEQEIREVTERLTQADKDHAEVLKEKRAAIDAVFEAHSRQLDATEDLVEAVERDIAGTIELAEAYSVSSREARIVAETQKILAKETLLSADAARELAEQTIEAEDRLGRARSSTEYLSSAFGDLTGVVSDFATGIAQGTTQLKDFGDIGEAALAKLLQRFLELSAINPLENLFLGGNAPTLSSVFSTGSSLFGGGGGGLSNLSGAGSFFNNILGGGSLTSGLVYSPAGVSFGLSGASPMAGAAGAHGLTQGLAPTALGSSVMQLGSLAVAPFLGMGAVAILSALTKKDGPRSAAQLGSISGRFGVSNVDVGNGGDPAVGQAIGEAASGIANAFLDISGARLGSNARLGMIGLDEKVFRSTTGSGAYDYSAPDTLGIMGLPFDGRTFDRTAGGQRAAAADFAARNLLKQVIEGEIEGISTTAADTFKLGLGNLARNIEASMSEEGAADFARRIEVLAGWDDLRQQMVGLDEIAGDTALRLEKAAESQRAFNDQVSALREEAAAAVAESGSGLAGIGSFIDDAQALFDPTGGNRFQIRYQLGAGGGTGSIDGNANVFTNPGENGIGGTLKDIFSFGANDKTSGVNPSQIVVFDELIETIDQNLGENGKLIDAFRMAGDNLDFNISKLTDILEERGVELAPILDDFFDADVARERLGEAADMARFKVDQFFDSLTGAADAISGPRQLFEDIVPAVSPIVEQFEALKAQIEATRPDIQALNEDLAAMGESVIDADAKIAQATGQAAEQAQNQFLAGLGIAVGADGTIRDASVDFDAINSLAETVKALDENARVLFSDDPRGLSGQVGEKISDILQSGVSQILSGAEDSATTLEQLNIVFGDRIADMSLSVSAAADPLEQFTEQVTAAASALDGQISELRRSTDASKALARGFYSAADSLLVDRSLSALSPGARLEEARRQILDLEGQFLAGDQSVASEIQGLSRPFLEAAQDVYGASANYAAESSFIQGLLRSLGDSVMSEMDVALNQLSVLEEIRDSLGGAANGNARDFGVNSTRNQALAALFPEFTKDFRDGNFVNFFSGISDGRRSVAQNIIDTINFANGGIMTSLGKVPLRTYGGGGIANTPQVALYGEGSLPEAFVPLPDGHRIPVAFDGAAAMNDNGDVVVAINSLGLRIASLEAVLHEDNVESIEVQRGVRKDLRAAGVAGKRR